MDEAGIPLNVKQFSDRSIAALTAKLETRLDAMDKATTILASDINRVPTTLDRDISKITGLFTERFNSLTTRIQDRDARSIEDRQTQKSATDTALLAQKEASHAQNEVNLVAIKKSDDATVKQIDSIVQLMESDRRAIDEKISGIISRLDRGDGRTTMRASSNSSTMTIITVLIAGFSLFVAGVSALSGSHSQFTPVRAQFEVAQPQR